jgi:hypothetical protein
MSYTMKEVPITWRSIAESSTPVEIGNDQILTAPIPIGFGFEFFGKIYKELYVSSEGFLTFLGGQGWGNKPVQLPSALSKIRNLIAGLWSNLQPDG